MGVKAWDRIFRSAGSGGGEAVWELFHENSKGSPYQSPPSPITVAAWRARTSAALEFETHPRVELPSSPATFNPSLARAIADPSPVRRLDPGLLTLEELGTLLYYAYGEIGDGRENGTRRPRTVPSVGDLYPLELFFHTTCVEELEAGLYHYHPTHHHLRQLRTKTHNHRIAPGLVDKTLAVQASAIVFLAALPERTVALYGDRGYRYVLLEAGAVIQNLNLTARGLGLACVNVGEFYDRQIDRFLGFDGLGISTVFVLGIGRLPSDVPTLSPNGGRETH